jgi:SAM-dependent methyltransferase
MWQKFSDRVSEYAQYRPTYAQSAVDFLKSEFHLPARAQIADVGAGTGIFSQQLLDAGFQVFAVEPGPEMRSEAEQALSRYALFRAVDGTASDTGLDPLSVELVTAAQAFHWFDAEGARREFKRILKPGGHVALLWNVRSEAPGFGEEYEKFLHVNSINYGDSSRGSITLSRLNPFFGRDPKMRKFANPQSLTWEALWGRYLSTSYSPRPDSPKFQPAQEALRKLFDRYQNGGAVSHDCETEVFFDTLD